MTQDCAICQRVHMANEGQNPFLIHEFTHSYLVLGDHQYFPGYCLILLKDHVRELHELSAAVQQGLFQELMTAGKAVVDTYRPWKMNYSCYGNLDQHVHWHLFPRYESDPDHRRNPWVNADKFKDYLISDVQRAEVIAKVRSKLSL